MHVDGLHVEIAWEKRMEGIGTVPEVDWRGVGEIASLPLYMPL